MDTIELRKQIDGLQYEIGGYLDQIRTLKTIAMAQEKKIEALVTTLVAIRDVHRELKQYEVADSIRRILTDLGIEVEDKPLKDNPPMSGKEPSEL
jgi:cysteinyl-tRNA synthetase